MDEERHHLDDTEMLGCTCFRLRRTARSVTRIYDHHLAVAGLTLTQYSLLSKLSRCPPQTMHQLADIMGMERTTLTRTLTPLLERGLILVGPGGDRRSKLVALSPAGRSAREAAQSHWWAAQEEIARRLGGAEMARLNMLLDLSFERLAE